MLQKLIPCAQMCVHPMLHRHVPAGCMAWHAAMHAGWHRPLAAIRDAGRIRCKAQAALPVIKTMIVRGLHLPTRGACGIPTVLSPTSRTCMASASTPLALCDAHCHAHDDADNAHMLAQLQAGKVALMGVQEDDFQRVEHCASLAPEKVHTCLYEQCRSYQGR